MLLGSQSEALVLQVILQKLRLHRYVRFWVKRVILAPRRELPVHPQEQTLHRFSAWFGTLSIEAHGDDRYIGKCPLGRSAKSQAVACSRLPAYVRLLHHSATAKR